MRRAAVAAVAILVACGRAPSNGGASADAALPGESLSPPPPLVADAAPSARCVLDASGVTFGEGEDRRSLVVGSAIPTNDGFAVGLVHSPQAGAVASVVRVAGRSVAEEWIVAKHAELLADAPPPIPLLGSGVLYAAYLAREADAGLSRRISLKKFGVSAPIVSFKTQGSDSLSFDAAISTDVSRAAITWDDDAPKDGGIRVAIASLLSATAAASRVVSDGVTDVDSPRLAARTDGGWWAAWTARREEDSDAGARVEAPGEARAYTWIEVVSLDPAGAPVGPIRKITAPTGHVGSFDLATRAHGELDVFARDEVQSREGEGGRVLHIVVRDASVDDAVTVATGAGRGAVDLIVGANATAWLSYVDAQDHSRLLALGESRLPSGPATPEEELDGARILAITSTASPSRFVAAVPTSDAPILRDVTCAR